MSSNFFHFASVGLLASGLIGCSQSSTTNSVTSNANATETKAKTEAAAPLTLSAPQRVFYGTYAGGKEAGVYTAEFNPKTGKVTEARLAGAAVNPSFLALHPNGKFLYAVSEAPYKKGDTSGSVVAFAVDVATGKLTKLNEESSRGADPCHLVVDKAGKNVLVANYTGGNVAVLPIGADGHLQPSTDIQQHAAKDAAGKKKTPHGHSINLDAANKFAFAADLGLDQIIIYEFDGAAGKLKPHGIAPLAAGAGPRHFSWHPSHKYAYVINETGNTMTTFKYDAEKGQLTEVQTLSTLPADFKKPSYTAEVVVHPTGKFVYGSNRGHDSIAIFTVDEATGKLTSAGQESTQGKNPRNFVVDPTGAFLLAENQDSSNVVIYKIDPQSGRLTPTGDILKVPQPVCIKFLPLPPK